MTQDYRRECCVSVFIDGWTQTILCRLICQQGGFIRAGALVTGAIALAPDADALQQEQKKIKVVVLGTGWGATSFLNALKPKHSTSQPCLLCGSCTAVNLAEPSNPSIPERHWHMYGANPCLRSSQPCRCAI